MDLERINSNEVYKNMIPNLFFNAEELGVPERVLDELVSEGKLRYTLKYDEMLDDWIVYYIKLN